MIGKQTLSVSVVIPCYNEENVILDCLHALLNQTELPDEIIVVDNNSTDATAKLANSMPEVTVISQSKQGIAWARNAGFDAAKSDVIARIDADTLVAENWIAQIKAKLRKPGVIGVSGPAEFYDHPFGLVADNIFNAWNLFGNKLISGSPILWGSNMAFYREYWLAVREQTNNDDYYWEDIDLSMRLLPFGQIVYSRHLRVATSARSTLTSPQEQARYFAHWPRTYAQFGRREWLTSRLLYLSLALLWLPAALAAPINRYRASVYRLERRWRAFLGI